MENFSTKNFFEKKVKNAQNRSIRKFIYLKSIFQHLHQISPITRWSEARLRKFFDQKFFEKFFFQKCSECFNSCKKHVFTILKKIFLSKWPRLSHFSTKNWTFRFWLFLFIYSLLVTRVDLLVQNKTAKMGLNEFCTPVVQEKPNSQENWL